MSTRSGSATERRSPSRGEVAAVFTALAHPARREILRVLQANGDNALAGEIADRFPCSWPTTSRHLAVLLGAGLVRVRRRGRQRVYSLDRRTLARVAGGWISAFR